MKRKREKEKKREREKKKKGREEKNTERFCSLFRGRNRDWNA